MKFLQLLRKGATMVALLVAIGEIIEFAISKLEPALKKFDDGKEST